MLERPRGLARLGYDVALARRLRAARFDLAIDFHGGPRSGFLTWASARRNDRLRPAWSRLVLHDAGAWTRSPVPPRHSVVNQWACSRRSASSRPTGRDAVTMTLDPEAVRRVDDRLAAAGIDRGSRLIVLHVSAGNPFRRWPASSFAAAAATLASEDPSRRIIITSGPSESAAAEPSPERPAGSPARRPRGSSAPASSTWRTRRAGRRAALFIGGDSGPLHVAATTHTPIVALFGPTLPERSMPWRDPAIGRSPSMPASCRAGPVTSVTASPATIAV